MEPIVIDPQLSSLVSIKKKKKNDPLEKRQSLKMNPINIDKNNIKKIENDASSLMVACGLALRSFD